MHCVRQSLPKLDVTYKSERINMMLMIKHKLNLKLWLFKRAW